MLGVSFLDAEVQDLFGDGTLTDVEMTNSPELALNGMVRYEWPAFGGTWPLWSTLTMLMNVR